MTTPQIKLKPTERKTVESPELEMEIRKSTAADPAACFKELKPAGVTFTQFSRLWTNVKSNPLPEPEAQTVPEPVPADKPKSKPAKSRPVPPSTPAS